MHDILKRPALCSALPVPAGAARRHPPVTRPEFCPRQSCPFHDRQRAARARWYDRFGTFHTRCRGSIQRFRCRSCGKTCSTQTFSVHYWTHSTNDLIWLISHLHACGGLRQIGRSAGVTHRVIINRVHRLARNALSVMDAAIAEMFLDEDLAMDGFESFARSQYHPNNITHVCGTRSQFIYAAVHTSLRRKGAMTDRQKAYRRLIDLVWSPATRIREDCTAMLEDLAPVIVGGCTRRGTLYFDTDRHRDYRPALRSVTQLRREMDRGRLVHRQTSSRAARTTRNPLFAVNYVDRQMRMTMAEHVRETMRQGREVNNQMERMALFMVVHNFATPHRVNGFAKAARCPTHAEEGQIESPLVRRQLERMVTHRHVWSHTLARQEWIRRIWLHGHENPPAVKVVKGRIRTRRTAISAVEMPRHLMV